MAVRGVTTRRALKRLRRALGIWPLIAFIGLSLVLIAGVAASTRNPVSLPDEIAGEPGTAVSATVCVPPGFGKQARSLWIQTHGPAYAGMVSVRINHGQWWLLNNETVKVAEPGRSYGYIGGAFASPKMTLPVPEGSVVDASNTIQCRSSEKLRFESVLMAISPLKPRKEFI